MSAPSSLLGRVVTIATGRPAYIEMAWNLARSFLHWNGDGSLRFTLCTDHAGPLPADLVDVEIVRIRPGECGAGFSPKLHLDRLVPSNAPVLFLDADCLVVAPLRPVFDRLRGRDFSLIGRMTEVGEFYGDVRSHLARAGVPRLPLFVGSLMYWENGDTARSVFASARAFESRYDELGISRMRGATADEPVVALAFGAHGLEPVSDDGTIKADAHLYDYPPEIDLFRGRVRFVNTAPAGSHVIPNPLRESRPAIAHFNAAYAFESPYLREALVLRLVRLHGWPPFAARAWALLSLDWPQRLVQGLKNLLRPAYRRLFGTRTIKPTPRET
jgi:hypothetical protein